MKQLNGGVNAGISIKSFVPVAAALLLQLPVQLPAQAQSYSYLPFALGSTLFYGLRYMGMGYSPYGMSGYSNPMWQGGNILGRSTRGMGGNGYNGYSPYGNPNFGAVNNDEQPVDTLNPNVIRYGPPVVSGSNSGSNSAANQNQNSNQPLWTPNSGRFPPYFLPANPALSQPTTAAPPAYAAGTSPVPVAYGGAPLAPNGIAYGHGNGAPYQPGAPNAGNAAGFSSGKHSGSQSASGRISGKNGGAPLAVSFLNSINTDYDGDIRKALANPGTRSWAQCLGVLPKSHKASAALTDSRANSINSVLRDESLDPMSKLDTLKILLKQ